MNTDSSEIRPYYKYLFRDFGFSIAFAFAVGVWVLAVLKIVFNFTFKNVFRGATTQETILCAIAVSVAGVSIATWRWLRLRSLFGHGVFVNAKILVASDRRLHLKYNFNGTDVEKIISPPDSGEALVAGSEIRIVVDPGNPKRIAIAS